MDEKKILSKEDILGMEDLFLHEMEIPEWGGVVYLRGLTAEERDDFEATLFIGEGKDRKFNRKNLRAKLLSLTVCNGEGEKLFTPEDAERLGKKSGKAVARLFEKAQELSGLRDEDVTELLKN